MTFKTRFAIMAVLLTPVTLLVYWVVLGLELQDKRGYETDLELAQSIQNRLVPTNLPSTEGLSFSAYYESARAVGGDYYDVISLDEKRSMVLIADVAGKGVPAALLMSGVRSHVRACAVRGDSPDQILSSLNRTLHADTETSSFVTMFCATIDVEHRLLEYANAGHELPLLVRTQGDPRHLRAGGLPIGVLPDTEYELAQESLDPGDRLVLYTDGVTEAQAPDGGFFDTTRLETVVSENRESTVIIMADAIIQRIKGFVSTHEQSDDITLLLAGID
jgi:sigma-B regulation protein RsbU (phosphoserine phosphatase)